MTIREKKKKQLLDTLVKDVLYVWLMLGIEGILSPRLIDFYLFDSPKLPARNGHKIAGESGAQAKSLGKCQSHVWRIQVHLGSNVRWRTGGHSLYQRLFLPTHECNKE